LTLESTPEFILGPMDSCCAPHSSRQGDVVTDCPGCGNRGTNVELRTLKGLLTSAALPRLQCTSHRFCKSPECDVVYFDETASPYRVGDLRSAVWQKMPEGDRTICYCFAETEAALRADVDQNTQSVIDRVRAHIDAGRCACDVRNPRGVCCLGDLAAIMKRLKGQRMASGARE
jgi:hypothetical protein